MKSYNHNDIEKKWQNAWNEAKLYRTSDDSSKPKCYVLDMFPYPSGDGLHVGHPKGYIATDVYSRMKTMQGFNVLHPMGWDAFGLPAEQFAIKNKVHPSVAVKNNTQRYKEQLEMIGFNYDWDREINTTDPKFYKWTQWTFLKMLERGLAYESYEPINWCPKCQTGLANEDLEDGKCERCETPVEKKPMRQWVLRITDYADRMLADLDKLDWPTSIKESQRNWIGRSEGAEITFQLEVAGQSDEAHNVTVFTTRPDTIFGATYLAVSPEHAQKWIDAGWTPDSSVSQYIKTTLVENSVRSFVERVKTGVFSGIFAINPVNNEKVPVWVVNYVLGDVGTGAIMGVPAHDERDFAFAEKFSISIKTVVEPKKKDSNLEKEKIFTGVGTLVNSGEFTGQESEKAKAEIVKHVKGRMVTKYRLKDWVFSRQRYWGEPIPIIHCEKCGVVPVPEKDLPVMLPQVESYEPTGTGESPLADIAEWVNTTCPKCGGKAKRETNTMPQWAGSSWYYLRFMDPHNDTALVDKDKEKYWSPVDLYVGGAEHATRHLIYARFWHKFLFDIGVVNFEEPFKRLQNVGLIQSADGRKMSKRWGNVINPDDVVKTFGADTLRVYEMFMGPFNQGVVWNTESIVGPRRFLDRVWKLHTKINDASRNDEHDAIIHKTIKKVSDDIETFGFNTAISTLMILLNDMEKTEMISREHYETLLILLAPFAPHITEELWYEIGNKNSIHLASWPSFDATKIIEKDITMVIQVNGKVRDTIVVPLHTVEAEIKEIILSRPLIVKWLEGKNIVKMIFVPGKLMNILLSE